MTSTVTPFCKYFGTCGGCKFQDQNEANYAASKRQRVVDALQRRGIDANVGELIDAHGKGRRRVVLHVREFDGTWRAGFMQARSHTLVDINACPILEPALLEAPKIAAAFGPVLDACDVAITSADNGLDVSIKAERSAVARRMPALQSLFHELKLIRLSVNNEIVFSATHPQVSIGKASVNLPINTFLQATAEGEAALTAIVLDALKKSKRIADLFCGVGPFALRLAERAQIHAVDFDKPAVSALQLAANNTQGLKPFTTEARDLFLNPLVPQELKEFDGIVFDPPRAGAESQARNIAKSKVKHVAAIACDADSFARDAKTLINGGYKLLTVTPVDQFKWTAHIEIAAVFRR
jgi:23S rRNA (uracil1939-C5)-methyltransferase